jgi:5'-nucleotidase
MITRVTLEIDRQTDRIVRASAVNEVVTRDVAKDPAHTQLLAQYEALAMTTANRVVGAASADIVRTANAAGESALGDLIADAQLAATSAPEAGGAVVALMNTGGIRADLVAATTNAANRPGELTYRDLFAVQPFGNVLTVITLSGAQIKELLEEQFDNPGPGQRTMLQVSRGFSYQYHLTAPAGQHVDATSIRLVGRPLDPGDRLRVAASDFVIDSGLYPVLKVGSDRVAGVADIEALVAYVKTHSPLVIASRDRIVRMNE